MTDIYYFTGFEGCRTTDHVQSLLSWSRSFANPSYSATGGYQNGRCLRVDEAFSDSRCFRIDLPDYNAPGGTYDPIAVGFHVRGMHYKAWADPPNQYLSGMIEFEPLGIVITNEPDGLEVRDRVNGLLKKLDRKVSSELTFFEAKVTPTPGAGEITLRINGVSVMDETGLNIVGGNITGVTFYNAYSVTDWPTYYDNIYLASDLVGEVCSYLARPSGDWATDWEPSSGEDSSADSSGGGNYLMVDEETQDDDTTYVTAFDIGDRDTYQYTDIPTTFDVVAVTLITVSRKYDAGYRALKHVGAYGGSEYEYVLEYVVGAGYPATVQEAMMEVLTEAPDCTAWTAEKFNNSKLGFKISG